MIKITWDQGFKRAYKKKVRENEDLRKKFWEAMAVFEKDPMGPSLRTHKLTGKLAGLWAFTVAYDCRVIFAFLNRTEVLLIDVGTHDEVY